MTTASHRRDKKRKKSSGIGTIKPFFFLFLFLKGSILNFRANEKSRDSSNYGRFSRALFNEKHNLEPSITIIIELESDELSVFRPPKLLCLVYNEISVSMIDRR